MVKKVWSFLGSIQLAIVLLIILAVISLVGVVIPQGLHHNAYLSQLGPFRSGIVLTLGFDRIFSTPFFYALLSLLSLSVLACTSSRLWKSFLESRKIRFLSGSSDLDSFKAKKNLDVSSTAGAALERVRRLLRGRFYSLAVSENSGTFQISARTGMPKEIGSLLFHLGIIVLLTAGLIGQMGGYSYMQELKKGEPVPVRDTDFLVRCDGFTLETNDKGEIKDYKSVLAILGPDGTVKKSKTIEVNYPLSYQGVRFYQSSYGEDADGVQQCALSIAGPGLPEEGVDAAFPFNSSIALTPDGAAVTITRFVPDFIKEEGGDVRSRSAQPNNPAIHVVISRGIDTLASQWLFLRYPNAHMTESPYTIKFLSYTPNYFTGIQIVQNPAVPIIWSGIIAMTIGIFLTFFGSRRRLWLFVEPRGAHACRVITGGTSNLPADIFQEEFIKLGNALERALAERKGAS